MGTAYTRQSSFSDGDTITAALFNDEYNQLLTSLSYASSGTTGHQHDGTAGEGGNVHSIGDQDFLNKIVADSTNNRWGVFVQVSSSAVEQIRISDGVISPVTDNDIDLGTSSLEFKDLFIDGTAHIDTLDVDVNATVAGTLGVTGALTGSSTIQGTTITATTAFVPDASDGAALGTSALEFSDLFLADGAVINFGDDQDVTITHVADTGILLSSTDQLQFGDSGTYIYQSADGVLDLVSDTEIELTATTIDINGAVAMDGAITGGTNITISGELDAATLDISGNADIDGTTNLDIVDIDGAVQIDATVTVGVDDTGYDVKFFGDTASAYMLWDTSADDLILGGAARVVVPASGLVIGSTAVTSTAAELNILDGVTSTAAELNILDGVTSTAAELNIIDGDTSATSTTLADADRVVVNDAGTMKQVALTDFETYFESAIDTFSTIDINGGSIDGATLGTNSAITQAVIDDIDLNGKVITMTGSASDTAVFTAGTNGTLSIVTTDAAAAAANVQITADGTVDIDSAGILTLDSGAAINIEPASGSAILLDGTISIDAGVVTGATSITSTAFVGDITGDVTGTADLATSITASANNSTDETVYPTFVDGATGTQGLETDTGLTYNPSSGLLTISGELDAATLDISGAIDIAGASTLHGVTTHGGNVVSDTDSTDDLGTTGVRWANLFVDAITATDQITATGFTGTLDGILGSGTAAAATVTTLTGTTITASTAFVPDASDGAALGTTALEFSDLFLADGAVINFGDDQDVTITHVADQGLNIKQVTDADDKALILTLQTGETDIALNDYLGRIFFQAPDEGSTGDAQLVGAEISALSEGDFSSTSNATSLIFATGASETAAQKMKLSSTGVLTLNGASGSLIIPNAGNIGSASDTDAIAISSGGVVTMNQIPVFSAGINVSGGTIAGTLATAAQGNVTSLGTLTALTVDDVAIDGKVVTMTGSSSDTAVFTAGTNGTLSIVTTDAAAAAANITITADGTFEADGTTITLDSAGDIILDADGADVIFKDGGTAILTFTNSSSDAVITSGVQDKDIIFKGDDGGSAITALTLDMSDAGAATFNNKIVATELDISGDIDINGTAHLDAVDVDGAVNFAADVTFADGADIITASAGTSNVRIGVNAGNSIESGGNYNVVVGDEAGTAITTGDQNVAVGYRALDANDTGGSNVASGNEALFTNTSGAGNVAMGMKALYANTTANYNVAVGAYALDANTTGTLNTSVGGYSLSANTDGDYNVAMGYAALLGNTTGSGNVAAGYYALVANTEANYNTAMGYNTLATCTTGAGNTAIGYAAMDAQATATNNTAVGVFALSANDSGVHCVAVGYGACDANTTASHTVGVGFDALGAVTTGGNNTALGNYAGDLITTGNNNTCVGYSADVSASGAVSQIVIGNSISGGEDSQVTIGKTSNVIQNEFDTDATWTRTSDRRKKRNIEDDELGLEFINNLRTVTHQWKPSNEFPEEWDEYSENNNMNLDAVMHGMIAQEVKEALDKSGCDTFAGWKERSDGSQTVSREMFVIPLIKAVQELSAEVKELKEKLNV
jgi:hypothetical protein